MENEATILKNTNIYGQIFSLSIDNENNIYFGKNDGLYKSIDNGQTNIKINNIPSYSVYSLSIDKQN
ncbi:hypothetical protein [Spiroplasma endosymbiont of Clivina fossor]|uniref:hypothetical protein n=1 Tax=Spiroplasma endosymbiont of Clivina fossor TaxID=3066282 RepID=UPI00313A7FEE